MSAYLVGVDLGQTNDYTAIAVIEQSTRPLVEDGQGEALGKRETIYQVRHLERLPLGTPYPAQVVRVKTVMQRLEGASLVVDQTGVGRPVVDMLRDEGLGPRAVTIHGGDQVSRDGGDYRVPKRELVSVLQVLLQTKRLQVASSLPEAATLVKEMLAFKVDISKSGHDTYGNDWRENPHDDMVLAVALACWYGEASQVAHVFGAIVVNEGGIGV